MHKRTIGLALALMLGVLAACAAPTPTVAPTAQPPAAIRPPADITLAPQPTSVEPTAAPVVKKGGDYKEVDTADAKTFQPYLAEDGTSFGYQGNVYASGLTMLDPKTLQHVPAMATSWDASPDATVYTFHLRHDLKWSDGQPMTAQDFAWTYEQASNPDHKYPYIDNMANIASYKAMDDYTIQVTLKQGECVGLDTADAVTPLPKHIWEKLDWSDPTKNPEIRKPSVVSGPYKVQEWKQDDHATFSRNDSYYRGAPNFDTDTVRIVPNTSVQFQMLKTGEVDYAPVTPADYAQAKQVPLLKEYDWDPAVAVWSYVGFNLRRPWLQDVEVRHALSYATPRDAIDQKIFAGLVKPTYSAIPPTSWAYNPNVPHYDYSIDTAKATLQKAGYKWDANGNLLNKDGTPFPTLKIYYNSGNSEREQVATVIQQEYKKIGINVQITSLEFQAYIQYLQTAPYDYDLYVGGWQSTFDPYFGYQIWSTSTIPDLNSGAYMSKQVDDLFTQSNRPPCDTASRTKVFQQIQSIISNDSPYVFLGYTIGYQFLNQRVVPNPPSVLGINYFPEQWYMKTP